MSSETPLLSVEDLSVRFDTQEGAVHAVNGIDFSIGAGETLGLVGESGSGKSVTALSLLRLLADTARVEGTVRFDGTDLLDQPLSAIRALRGNRISMVFQDPGSSLNPVLPVGDQISETIRTHQDIPGEGITRGEQTILGNLFRSDTKFTEFEESWERTVELFDRVGIPLPEQRALEYPHEFSGGMKQRALIAIAVSCQPDLLIADEPTTALDVTIEAQILELIQELQREIGTAVLFITHDMGVIREVSDRVAVMYAGQILESAPTGTLFESPKHPYTRTLLRSVPRLSGSDELDPVPGQVPELMAPPTECPFVDRCPAANDACRDGVPPAYPVRGTDEPLPVEPRSSTGAPSTAQPAPRDRPDADHTVHCVLYGREDATLTAPASDGSGPTTPSGSTAADEGRSE